MPGDTGSILRKGGEGRDCIHRNGGDSGQHDHHHRLGDLGVGVELMTSNPLLSLFLAASLLGVGVGVFRKIKRASRG